MIRLILGAVTLSTLMAVLVACTDDSTATPTTPAQIGAAPTAESNPSSPATQIPTPEVAETGASGVKLSANSASRSELAAAFEAAGISNASKWAREVEEYRPYREDDTDYSKLRGELAKYNPAPGVVDSIIALLELP